MGEVVPWTCFSELQRIDSKWNVPCWSWVQGQLMEIMWADLGLNHMEQRQQLTRSKGRKNPCLQGLSLLLTSPALQGTNFLLDQRFLMTAVGKTPRPMSIFLALYILLLTAPSVSVSWARGCTPGIPKLEADAGQWPWVQGQPVLYNKSLTPKTKTKTKNLVVTAHTCGLDFKSSFL